MTRVLIIESSGNLWGSERALLDLLAGIPDVKAAVVCPPETPLQGALVKRNISALPYFVYALHQKSKWQRLLATIGVLRACSEFWPDVIYLNQSGSYKIALFAAILMNLPIVAHIRIFEDVAYLACLSHDPRRLRGLIAISAAKETVIRRFPQLKAISHFCIYDAYASKLLPTFPSVLADSRKNRIACIGRVVPSKGQDVLVDAVGLMQNLEGGWECLIAGPGEANFVERL